MINKLIKNNHGLTLLEIVVALSIFSVIVVMAVGIFQAVLVSQQSAVAAQNEQESLKYLFEVVSKDIRSAISSNHDCEKTDLAINKIFNEEATFYAPQESLYFSDKNGVCTYYYIKDGTFMIEKGGVISSTTPNEVAVKKFSFLITDNLITDVLNTLQPMVTFSLEIENRRGKDVLKQNMTLQTTISSRFYE